MGKKIYKKSFKKLSNGVNFWQSLPKPFFVQAPMEGVTDTVFRQVLLKTGRPDVFFTEFTNVDSFCSEKGRADAMKRFRHVAQEKPLVAQIWGSAKHHADNFFKTARALQKMEFSAIDINMGCTEHNVVKNGCGGALINNRREAKDIIEAVRRGAGNLPVSVKTRLGFSEIQTNEWLGFLLEQKLDALSVHMRTVREVFSGNAHWEEMEKIVALRSKISPATILIGNGDIKSRTEGQEKAKKYGIEGVMVGRALLQNIWLFSGKKPENIALPDKIASFIFHLQLFQKNWGKTKDWNALKKFYKVYVSGFPDAAELRMKLMEFKSAKDTIKYLQSIAHSF